MSSKHVLIGVGAAVVAILLGWLIIENDKKGKIIKQLEIDNLKLLKESLKKNKSISEEIKYQLLDLFNTYKNIDSNIAKEISTALTIIDAGEEEKGIGSLSIIIESLLETKYRKSNKFSDWLKNRKNKKISNAVQADYIEFAKEDNLLNKEEHDFAIAVKNIRNGTFHKPGNKLAWNYQKAGILVGIELVIKIGRSLQKDGRVVQFA